MNRKIYQGDYLNNVVFPMGGIGAGMLCLQGTGALGSVSFHNHPDVYNEPTIFSAICVKGETNIARILEGQVPYRKIFGGLGYSLAQQGNGLGGTTFGLPRFRNCRFEGKFPFAEVSLSDNDLPIAVTLIGWSPFIPNDADNSSLPAAALEYTFVNTSNRALDCVYYFNSFNFMQKDKHAKAISAKKGFIFRQPPCENAPWDEGEFSAWIDEENTRVNCLWFRGGWFDPQTMLWNDICAGVSEDKKEDGGPASLGATLSVEFHLEPGESKTIAVGLNWYVPNSNIRFGPTLPDDPAPQETYHPWYSAKFDSVAAVSDYFRKEYAMLRTESKAFSDCLFDTDLPDEIVDAVSSNLSIMKAPTILRQTDGRLWVWEGCHDQEGACAGSCTHVWNYAQAFCNLFPELERSLRQTEFHESQDEYGHQTFRASLPIRPTVHDFHAASDGQFGGIMKVYRDWRISGDSEWLRSIFPQVKQSIDYCIRTWDSRRMGVLTEPHHNTYDIEFWGADGMCTSFYLGALRAMEEICKELGEDASEYIALYQKGRAFVETELFNGEYFYQKMDEGTFDARPDLTDANPETAALLKAEGPKYQYKTGCLSDGVLGALFAKLWGLGDILDPEKVKSHLLSVHRYNFKPNLIQHANPQRPGYAVGDEAGMLLCTWPNGEKPSLPFVYSDEVWTGIEYQVATHLLLFGCEQEALDIIRGCRGRYDGKKRNPFDEYEWGHWYGRALASYGLLQAYSGVRYDKKSESLTVEHPIRDCKVFLCTVSGYGTAIVRDDSVEIQTVRGKIKIN